MSKIIKNIFVWFMVVSCLLLPVLSYAATGDTTSNLWPWYITRASGLVAYILLFFLVASGVGIKTSWLFKFISPTFAWINHRYLGIALSAAVVTHLISLLLDTYLKFSVIDVFVPFVSNYKPLLLSAGIIGLYILLVVMFSSLVTINKFPKAWRLLHYLTYPLFIILFIHGYFIGTDTKFIIIKLIYLITGVIVAWLSLYRLYFFYKQK
jgi:Ferric reductase like transmembrane component.